MPKSIFLCQSLVHLVLFHTNCRHLFRFRPISKRFLDIVLQNINCRSHLDLSSHSLFPQLFLQYFSSQLRTLSLSPSSLSRPLLQRCIQQQSHPIEINLVTPLRQSDMDSLLSLIPLIPPSQPLSLLLPVHSDVFISLRQLPKLSSYCFKSIHLLLYNHEQRQLFHFIKSTPSLTILRINPLGLWESRHCNSLVKGCLLISKAKSCALSHLILHPRILRSLGRSTVDLISTSNFSFSLIGISPIFGEQLNVLAPVFSKMTVLNWTPFDSKYLKFCQNLKKLSISMLTDQENLDFSSLSQNQLLETLVINTCNLSTARHILQSVHNHPNLIDVTLSSLVNDDEAIFPTLISQLPINLQSFSIISSVIPGSSLDTLSRFSHSLKSVSIKSDCHVDDVISLIFDLPLLESLFLSRIHGKCLNSSYSLNLLELDNFKFSKDFKLSLVNCNSQSLGILSLLFKQICNLTNFVIVQDRFPRHFLKFLLFNLKSTITV
ncbi:hypothetical protein GEMRC1_010422 [Eukaryota sp. GEM-RC1]